MLRKMVAVAICIAAFAMRAGGQTPTFVQSATTGTSSTSSTLAFPSNVTAGDALYAVIYDGSSSTDTLTFTDSQANSWTTTKSASLTTDGDTIAVGCAIAGASGSDRVTFKVNGSTAANFGSVFEVANATCTPDVTPISSDTSAQTACNSGSLTTVTANDLLVGFCGLQNQQTSLSPGSGWSSGSTSGTGGEIYALGEIRVATTTGAYSATSSTYGQSSEQGTIEVAFKASTTGGGGTQTAVTTGGGTTNTLPVFTASSTLGNSVITQSGSNIGIGTTTPTFPLTVNGTASASAYCFSGANCITSWPSGSTSQWTTSGANIYFNSGNIGIGTTAPAAPLHIHGTTAPFQAITVDTSDPSYNTYMYFPWGTSSTNGLIIGNQTEAAWTSHTNASTIRSAGSISQSISLEPGFDGSGNVGVVQIYNSAAATSIANQSSPTLWLKGSYWTGSGSSFDVYQVSDVVSNGTNPRSILQFSHTGATGGQGYAFLNGNVGIGTTNPQATLEVNGSLRFTADGSVQTTAWTGVLCGGDYAESIDVTGNRQNYEPGDVLVIDPKEPGKFLKSDQPYSSAVAGIFSTNPGAVGRRQTTSKNPDEIPMAVIGIVPVKVSAENGPIHPRDLLVSASIPGFAMKGTDRNQMMGAVVGKAMGSLDSGTGVIEVLVTLQ